MKKLDAARIRERIEHAAQSEVNLSLEASREVGFHMTDWLSDLEAYYQFCRNPDDLSDQGIVDVLTNFLVHVPNHVAAAGKLFADLPVTDIFGVGATTDEESDAS